MQPEAMPDGGYKVRHDPTTLGSGRVDITASSGTGASAITSAVAVPLEALLDVRTYPHSVEAGTTTTYNTAEKTRIPTCAIFGLGKRAGKHPYAQHEAGQDNRPVLAQKNPRGEYHIGHQRQRFARLVEDLLELRNHEHDENEN